MKLKILHGPVNICGIAGKLAEKQREKGHFSESITYYDRFQRYKNQDINFDLANKALLKRVGIILCFFVRSLFRYNIFHLYYGRTLLPLGLDLPLLKLFRKKILMTYCGSDIRLIKDVEAIRNPYVRFLNTELNKSKYDNRKKLMMRWQNIWVDKFFAIRIIYRYVENIIPKHKVIRDIWINNVMDMRSFYPTFKTKDIPTLVHAPTKPELKGSIHIEKAIEELKAEGCNFEYIRLESIYNSEVQRICCYQADIIVDQLYLGGFGSFAVEGMYYGKPVCAFLLDELIKEYPDCPIVNCKIENLKEKIRELINNSQKRIDLGKLGRNFVEKHCDIDKINQKLLELYKELLRGKS